LFFPGEQYFEFLAVYLNGFNHKTIGTDIQTGDTGMPLPGAQMIQRTGGDEAARTARLPVARPPRTATRQGNAA
jgi:hypothetical protein